MSDCERRSGSRSPEIGGRFVDKDPAGASPGRRSRSISRSYSRSRSRSYSRSRSRSRSRHRRRSYSRSFSRSRSRSYSPRRKRGHYKRSRSRSPLSNRKRHQGDRYNPKESRVIGVFGLSLYTGEKDLRDLLSKYGDIDRVQVVYDHQTGRSRGFAFVYFKEVEDAIDAKEHVNGVELDGRRLRVDYSITKRPHTPTPGVYMGRPTRPGGDDGYDRYHSKDSRGGGDRYERDRYDRDRYYDDHYSSRGYGGRGYY